MDKNKIKTRAFDVTNYLHNELDIAAHLRAAIKDGDQVLLASALGDAASAFGKTQLTNDNGLTKKFLRRFEFERAQRSESLSWSVHIEKARILN